MQQGKFFRFVRWLGRCITYPNQIVWREQKQVPSVYLCRHMNQHGPLVSILWMPAPMHFWGLHVYCDLESSRRHFADYTLSQRCGLPKWLAKLLAYPVGYVMYHLCTSGQAIPVYRDRNSFKTMGASVKALQAGDDILLFPDIDYTNRQGGTDLYDGFLYLERFYYHATGQHVNFVPIYLHDEEHQIIVGEAIRFEDGDFDQQRPLIMQRLVTALAGDL